MKIRILSDLHLEFEVYQPKKVNEDLLILAGDIHLGTKGIEWIKNYFPDIPVLYVLGNHEFYKHAVPKLIDDIKKKTEGTNIHVLEKDSITVGGIAFFGCTFWTDYCLINNDSKLGILEVSYVMSDYKLIRIVPAYRKLRPEDTIAFHKSSLKWLKESLYNCKKKVVIITHHAPSTLSFNPAQLGFKGNAAYASNLETVINSMKPVLWIHGHIHYFSDYMIGSTRVLCNPKGYPDERDSGFQPDLIIEI